MGKVRGGDDGDAAVRRRRQRRRRWLEDGGVAWTAEKKTVAGARSGGGRRGGGGGGWIPFPAFLEQPLEREITPFFLQMTARVCGGGGPFPSYRAHNWPRGERAHLRPTTQHLKIIIEK